MDYHGKDTQYTFWKKPPFCSEDEIKGVPDTWRITFSSFIFTESPTMRTTPIMELHCCYVAAVLVERDLKLCKEKPLWPEEQGKGVPGIQRLYVRAHYYFLSLFFLLHFHATGIRKRVDVGNKRDWGKYCRFPKSLCELNLFTSYECKEHMQSTMAKSLGTQVWYKTLHKAQTNT